MKVFALICSVGVSSGYKELIGLYTTVEKAEESKKKNIKETIRGEWHYSIKEVEVDKEICEIYDEWGQ